MGLAKELKQRELFQSIYLLPFLLISCCAASVQKQNTAGVKITGIKISRTFPVIDTSGKVIRYDPFDTNIFQFQDQIIYQTHYHNIVHTGDSSVYSYPSYFFVYSLGNKWGILYDSARQLYAKPVPVDSVLSTEWVTRIDFGRIFDENSFHLISRSSNNAEMEETYALTNRKDTLMTGTIRLKFTDNKGLSAVRFSLSPSLDSSRNKKLWYANLINDSRYLKESNKIIDTIDISYSLEILKIDNTEQLLRYYNADKKVNGNKN